MAKRNQYWLLLLALVLSISFLLTPGAAHAHYYSTATWNTLLVAENAELSSNCLVPDGKQTILLGELPVTGKPYDFTLEGTPGTAAPITWAVNEEALPYLDAELRIGDTLLSGGQVITIPDSGKVTLTLFLNPVTTRVYDSLPASITVNWGEDKANHTVLLGGTFQTTLPAVVAEDVKVTASGIDFTPEGATIALDQIPQAGVSLDITLSSDKELSQVLTWSVDTELLDVTMTLGGKTLNSGDAVVVPYNSLDKKMETVTVTMTLTPTGEVLHEALPATVNVAWGDLKGIFQTNLKELPAISDTLTPTGTTVVLDPLPTEGQTLPFTLSALADTTVPLTWSVDTELVNVTMAVGDTPLTNDTALTVAAGETVTVNMTMTPAVEVEEITAASIQVAWGELLSGTFQTTLEPPVTQEDPGTVEEPQPEETEPTEPEVTEPPATEPTEPEVTEPPATEPANSPMTTNTEEPVTDGEEPATGDNSEEIPSDDGDNSSNTGDNTSSNDDVSTDPAEETTPEETTPEETTPEETTPEETTPEETTPEETTPEETTPEETTPEETTPEETTPEETTPEETTPEETTPEETTPEETLPEETVPEETTPEPVPLGIQLSTLGHFTPQSLIPVELKVSSDAEYILLSQAETAEAGSPMGLLPAFTRYTFDGEYYYLLYNAGTILLNMKDLPQPALPEGAEPPAQTTVMLFLDLSATELSAKADLILVANAVRIGQETSEKAESRATLHLALGDDLAQTMALTDRNLLTVSQAMVLTDRNPLTLTLPESWKGLTLTHTVDVVVAEEADDMEPRLVYHAVVEDREVLQVTRVAMGNAPHVLTLRVGTKPPPAGTYLLTLSWYYQEICIQETQITFFVNYPVNTEPEETGGAVQ